MGRCDWEHALRSRILYLCLFNLFSKLTRYCQRSYTLAHLLDKQVGLTTHFCACVGPTSTNAILPESCNWQYHLYYWGQYHLYYWGQYHLYYWGQYHLYYWGQYHLYYWGQYHLYYWGQLVTVARLDSLPKKCAKVNSLKFSIFTFIITPAKLLLLPV